MTTSRATAGISGMAHPPPPGLIAATPPYDAILRNLAVIGEAVRSLRADIKAAEADTPWASIAGLRNILIHEYFRVERD